MAIGIPDAQAFRSALDDVGSVLPDFATPPADLRPYRDRSYPRLHPSDEYKHPWKYPSELGPEQATTWSGPYPRRATPDVLFQNTASDPAIRDALEAAPDQESANAIGPALRANRHLGDAVGFASYLIWLESRDNPQPEGEAVPLVDWNLDADRGYGHHCWDWNRNAEAEGVADPEGYKFQPPCTWPSQADPPYDKLVDPNVPLRLHWSGSGLLDPGCSIIGAGILAALERGARCAAAEAKAAPDSAKEAS